MKLSIVIPAFNEAQLIAACVRSIRESLAENASTSLDGEIIVVDNASTDATGELAERAGARVVFEPVQQIARARNAGARVASGDWLLFVDGDSVLHPGSLADMLHHVETGRYVGGGCTVGLNGAPLLGQTAARLWNVVSRSLTLAAGSFLFCRTDAFGDIGGFDETLFAAEELALTAALKRWGKSRRLKFVILRKHPHVSSGRKFYLYGYREMFELLFRAACHPRRLLRSRHGLDFFYDGRR